MSTPIIIKNARVKTSLVLSDQKARFGEMPELNVVIEVSPRSGGFEVYRHTFDRKSSVHKMSQEMEFPILEAKFDGGTYVIMDGEIVDFRFSDYKGYIRNQSQINEFSESIGVSRRTKSSRSVGGSLGTMFNQLRHKNGVFFGGVSENEIHFDVEGFKEGGEFKNRLVYRWSPFEENIQTTVETERLICANGMMGMASLVTRETPMINDIERHLRIMETQLNPEMSRVLRERFADMLNKRASVYDVQKALSMITERLNQVGSLNEHDYKVLMGLADAISLDNLKGVFAQDLYTSHAAKVAPSDITQFDLFNVMTEMSTHTSGSEYQNRDAQMFINTLVFDRTQCEVSGEVKLSEHSNPNRVFFGK